jgi:hypothetical protein
MYQLPSIQGSQSYNSLQTTIQADNTCYRIQVAVATTFFLIGSIASSISIPKLVNILSSINIRFTGTIDKNLFTEEIQFIMDTDGLYKNTILALVGIFTTLLSTGMFLGLACRNWSR